MPVKTKIRKLLEWKKRPKFKPFSIIGNNLQTAITLCSDEKILLKSLKALNKWSMKNINNAKILLQFKIMELLWPLCLDLRNRKIRCYAWKLYARMSDLFSARLIILKDPSVFLYILELFISENNDMELQKSSSKIIAKFSSLYSICIQLLTTDVAYAILKRMESQEPNVQKNCLQITLNIFRCCGGYSLIINCELFSLDRYLALLHSIYPAIQTLALKIIGSLTKLFSRQSLQESFRQSHGFEELIHILEDLSCKSIHKETEHIISNCIKCPTNWLYFQNSGCLVKLLHYYRELIILALTISEITELKRMVEEDGPEILEDLKLWSMKNIKNEKVIYQLIIMELLWPLCLDLSNCKKRCFALKLCARISELPAAREIILQDSSIILYILELFISENNDVELQKYSSKIIAQLSSEASICIQLLTTTDIAYVILTRMESRIPELQKNCLQITWNMFQWLGGYSLFIDCELFSIHKYIAFLLRDRYPAIQTLALKIIGSLTKLFGRQSLQESFRQICGFEVLIIILKDGYYGYMHEEIEEIILNCMNCPTNCLYLLKPGCLDDLLDYYIDLKKGNKNKLMMIALKIIDSVDGQKILYAHNFPQKLYEMMFESEDKFEMFDEKLSCVSRMCRHYKSFQYFISKNLIVKIMDIVLNEDNSWDTRKIACHISCFMVKRNVKTREQIINLHKQDSMLEFIGKLGNENVPEGLIRMMVNCLMAISENEKLRRAMFDLSMITTLLNCMMAGGENLYTNIKTAACNFLSQFVNEPNFIEWFLTCKGVDVLTKCLLKSQKFILKAAAAQAVINIGIHKKIALAFLASGLVEKMIQQDSKMPILSRSWKVLIDTMLKRDLSRKFAIMGRLDMADVICDTFYVKETDDCCNFTLEDFLTSKMSPIRPMYVVNFDLVASESFKQPVIYIPPTTTTVKPKQKCSNEASSAANTNTMEKIKNTACKNILEKPVLEEKISSEMSLLDNSTTALIKRYSECIQDPYLPHFVQEVVKQLPTQDILLTPPITEKTIKMLAKILGRFVCRIMGGHVPYYPEQHERHINQIKVELGTNLIPLSYIRMGSCLERAILFKVLADRIGFPCSLVRKCCQWACIEIACPHDTSKSEKVNQQPSVMTLKLLKHCKLNAMVDLKDNPGELIPLHSYEAQEHPFNL